VGKGIVDGDNSEFEVEMTDSDSESEEDLDETNEAGPSHGAPYTLTASMTRTSGSEISTGQTHPSGPTFSANMTPSESSIGPSRTTRASDTIHTGVTGLGTSIGSTRRTRTHRHRT
jgi:hypothetical protein